jgi:hypothetical protein
LSGFIYFALDHGPSHPSLGAGECPIQEGLRAYSLRLSAAPRKIPPAAWEAT